jgi:transcriptional regulator with XRE-family HTH domain
MVEVNVDKERVRELIKAWLEQIIARTGWTTTHLANKANIAPSTLLRLFSDKNHTFVPSFSTLTKVSNASGYRIDDSILNSFGVNERGIDVGMPVAARSQALAAAMAARGGDKDDAKSTSRSGDIDVGDAKPAIYNKGKSPDRIRVRFVSGLPKSIQPMTRSEVYVDRPARYAMDDTAFAFYLPDSVFGPLLPSGSLLFASKARDPQAGDVLLLTRTDGRSMVRVVTAVNEAGVTVVNGDESVTVPFEEIEDFGVVSVMERI